MCRAFTIVLRVVAPSYVPRDYDCDSFGGSFVCVCADACLRAAHSGEGQEGQAPRFYGHQAYPHPYLSWGEADQLPLVVGRRVPVPLTQDGGPTHIHI